MAKTGSAVGQSTSRIFGNVISFSLGGDNGAGNDFNAYTGGGAASKIFSNEVYEVDKFTAQWKPQTTQFWPAGLSHPKVHAVNGTFDVTIEGGQTDIGFAAIVAVIAQAMEQGKTPPKFLLKRTAAAGTNGGVAFSETYKNGVVTDWQADNGLGSAALTNRISFSFETMETTGTGGPQ